MAAACGVDFAAALWGYDIEPIERFMRENCEYCFKTTKMLYDFLFR